MRVKYADNDEVISAGEVYYLPAGHNMVAEEDMVKALWIGMKPTILT